MHTRWGAFAIVMGCTAAEAPSRTALPPDCDEAPLADARCWAVESQPPVPNTAPEFAKRGNHARLIFVRRERGATLPRLDDAQIHRLAEGRLPIVRKLLEDSRGVLGLDPAPLVFEISAPGAYGGVIPADDQDAGYAARIAFFQGGRFRGDVLLGGDGAPRRVIVIYGLTDDR